MRAKINLTENYTYTLYRNGVKVPLYKLNKLGELLNRAGLLSLKRHYPLLGNYVPELTIANIITNAGRVGVATRIGEVSATTPYKYIALGLGTNAPAVTDTALQNEITTFGGARATGETGLATTTVANDTTRVVYTFGFTDVFAITEAGLFNAILAGTMLSRQTFSAINVQGGDTLQVDIKISVA